MSKVSDAKVELLKCVEDLSGNTFTVVDISRWFPDPSVLTTRPCGDNLWQCPKDQVKNVINFMSAFKKPVFHSNGIGYVRLKGRVSIPWFKLTKRVYGAKLLDEPSQIGNFDIFIRLKHMVESATRGRQRAEDPLYIMTPFTPMSLKPKFNVIARRVIGWLIDNRKEVAKLPVGTKVTDNISIGIVHINNIGMRVLNVTRDDGLLVVFPLGKRKKS